MFKELLGRRLRRSSLVCAGCLSLAAGLFVARLEPLAFTGWVWLLAVPAVCSLRRHACITLLLVSAVCFGVGWWRGSQYVCQLQHNQAFYDRTVTLMGRATEDAVYGKRYQLEFGMDEAYVASAPGGAFTGSITVRGFGEPAIYRGDQVMVTGKLYQTRGNAVAAVSFASLQVVQRDHSWLNAVRRRFAAGMQSALPEPLASFALGLLIGQRSTLPEDTNDQLRRVGLTHIVAVSGANLTIIVMACRKMLAKRSKFQTTTACLALVGTFLLVTGSSPPIVRASVICLLSLWAWYYGREIKPLTLVLAGAAITVICNPLYLWGNVSWYLSFLSFLGVLVVGPLVAKRIYGSGEPGVVGGVIMETICASVLVVPYVLYIFGQTSLVSLPANVLVVPFIPLAMALSLLAGLAGMLAPLIAGWLAWPAAMLLTCMIDIAAALSRVPHAFIEDVGVSSQMLAGMYGIIGVVLIILHSKVTARNASLS